MEVKTAEEPTIVSTVAAVQQADNDDHPTVVILHPRGEVDFLGLDSAAVVFVQLHCPAAGTVS